MKIDWLWFFIGIAFSMFVLPMLMGLFGGRKGAPTSSS